MNFVFLEVNLNNIFYNICGIIIGLILIAFGIFKIIKQHKKLFPIVCFIHAALFIFFGILGFFIPEDYDFIPILSLLAFTITMILSYILLNKKEN